MQELPKVELCLKKEVNASSSGVKPQVPQEPAPTKQPKEVQATCDQEDSYVPPARVTIGIQRNKGSPLQRLALVDMSADKNMVSNQTWCMLGKPNLGPATKFVQKSAHVVGDCLGVIEVLLKIGDHSKGT